MKARFLLAATGSGVGKTTLTLALLNAFADQGVKVAPFKVGPDYIDPLWHKAAANVPSYNLDGWLLPPAILRALLHEKTPKDSLAIIEGVMGLYDGLGVTDEASSAHVARLTGTPVVLVVDGRGISFSAAAIVLGFRDLDPSVSIGGVIINQITSEGHYHLIKKAIEKETGVPVLGWLPKSPDLILDSRQLGLVPPEHCPRVEAKLSKLGSLAKQHIELERLRALSGTDLGEELPRTKPVGQVKVALAKDAAFAAYDQGTLDLWQSFGASFIPFSPLHDQQIPQGVQAVMLCGSATSHYAHTLSQNRDMCASFHNCDLPIWAEGLGAAYLGQELDGHLLTGLLEHKSYSSQRLVRFGYIETTVGRAQEFRYIDGEITGANVTAYRPNRENSWSCGRHEPGLHVFWAHTQGWSNPGLIRDFLGYAINSGSIGNVDK
mgnify:FL=1